MPASDRATPQPLTWALLAVLLLLPVTTAATEPMLELTLPSVAARDVPFAASVNVQGLEAGTTLPVKISVAGGPALDSVLMEGDNQLGRSPESEIVLSSRFISRKHARLVCSGDTITFVPVSEQLTKINGEDAMP